MTMTPIDELVKAMQLEVLKPDIKPGWWSSTLTVVWEEVGEALG